MLSFFKKDPAILLKEATAKKKIGDFDEAIALLRKAYKQIEKGTITYSVDTFLRLPLYLQCAGRNDEAWKEFNLLIINGHSGLIMSKEMLPMHNSKIYDKMRLFLQREKKFDKSIKFGILSHLSWCDGLYQQGRKKELKKSLSEEAIKKILQPLLKKAKKTSELNLLVKKISADLTNYPNVSMANIANRVEKHILGI